MNYSEWSSRYLINEIPDDIESVNEFGRKAYNLSLAKKWQFSVPDSVFLSGNLVKEIFEKKYIPSEIISYFKNKFLAIRPSPVVGKFTKYEPYIYIGLEDQSFNILEEIVGLKKL